jgi:hypothetical protein
MNRKTLPDRMVGMQVGGTTRVGAAEERLIRSYPLLFI